jgi:acyl-coenzyme A thioesterase PaaI-like protein
MTSEAPLSADAQPPPSALPEDSEAFFISRLGFDFEVKPGSASGSMELTPEMMDPTGRSPSLALMSTAGDVVIGQVANQMTQELALTVDLSVELLGPVEPGRLAVRSALVKVGRTLISGEAYWHDGRGRLVARCWASFMASPRPADMGVRDSDAARQRIMRPDMGLLTEPFADLLQIRTTTPGTYEIARRPAVLQPTGTLQGGTICAIGECAAVSVLGAPLLGLDTRYLGGIRIGDGRATATAVTPTVARVEVVDTQRTDRVAAVLWARSG